MQTQAVLTDGLSWRRYWEGTKKATEGCTEGNKRPHEGNKRHQEGNRKATRRQKEANTGQEKITKKAPKGHRKAMGWQQRRATEGSTEQEKASLSRNTRAYPDQTRDSSPEVGGFLGLKSHSHMHRRQATHAATDPIKSKDPQGVSHELEVDRQICLVVDVHRFGQGGACLQAPKGKAAGVELY